MSMPTLTETGQRLVNGVSPLLWADGEHSYAGTYWLKALAAMVDPVATLVQPSTSGKEARPGYAILMDPETCPAELLPWLGQFVGIPSAVLAALPEASGREWIKQPVNYTRGTNEAMEQACAHTLTGSKTIHFYERWEGNPFKLKVATLSSQTPNPQATREAIEAYMCAWQVLTFVTVSAGTYAELEAAHGTYSGIEAAHTTYEGLESEPSK